MPRTRESARRLSVALHRRLLAVVVCAVAVFAVIPAAASADSTNGTSLGYSDTYKKLLAAFPSGYADSCDIAALLNGAGSICDARVDLVYFYPDGTLGGMPWYPDESSAAGWSVQPDPCDGLTGAEYQLWAVYVDYVNGYLDAGPDLTAAQIDRYGACWGWWF